MKPQRRGDRLSQALSSMQVQHIKSIDGNLGVMPTRPTCLVTKSRQRPKLIGRRSRKAQRLLILQVFFFFLSFFLSQLRARSANIKISTIESDGVTNSVHKPHFLGDKSRGRGGGEWRTYRDVQKNHMLYIVSMLKSEGRL